jgi:hypothetical protein
LYKKDLSVVKQTKISDSFALHATAKESGNDIGAPVGEVAERAEPHPSDERDDVDPDGGGDSVQFSPTRVFWSRTSCDRLRGRR